MVVRTRRQQQNIDDHEEEDEEYHQADMPDMMIMMEEGKAIEEVERRTGQADEDDANFERVLQNLRKACVSEKSQNNYLCSMTNMINWSVAHADDKIIDNHLLNQSWYEQLIAIDNDMERKILIRNKLSEADREDPPIDFDTFKAGK